MGRRRIFNFPKVPRRQQKSGTAPTGSGTNTISGLKYEDFNVYGIHGAGGESDSPPDGPDNLSFPTGPSQRNNAAENICPWELDDIGCTAILTRLHKVTTITIIIITIMQLPGESRIVVVKRKALH